MRRLWYVMWKELLELRQDPRLFGIIFIAPVIQLTMLGYAATTDVKNVPIVVVDQDGTPASRQLVSRFDASPYFTVVATLPSIRDVDPWLERGKAWMALAIPADYHTGTHAQSSARKSARPCRSRYREAIQKQHRFRPFAQHRQRGNSAQRSQRTRADL
jgi:ABC-2 type transport system permease protein